MEEFTADDGDLNAQVLAWGLAHADGSADASAVSGGLRLSLRSPQRALQWFTRIADGGVRLVWAGPR